MRRKQNSRCIPGLTILEGRRLLSVTTSLDGGVLTIRGDRANDVVTLTEDQGRVEIHGRARRGAIVTFSATDVQRVVFIGNAGNDRFTDDTDIPLQAFGGPGNDRLIGGRGNDDLRGDVGRDFLSGGLGDDSLQGGAGDDRLSGDDGNDLLDDHRGRNQLDGGHGADDVAGGADLSGGDAGDVNDDRGGGGGHGADDRAVALAPPVQNSGTDDSSHPDGHGQRKR
ncbi:MAG: hypothetical protein JWN86_2761 [Planctomycetota bacterium]|nr:hypothetical protein [Planctomycetota bacterium]